MDEQLELVIFDCDGVLVDSEVVAVEVDQRVLADLGWNLTREEIVERFVGGTKEIFELQLEEFLGAPVPPDWDRRYTEWYRRAFEQELKAVAGIEDAIDRLSLPFCVASNSGHARIRSSLAATGLLDRFEGRIFSSDDVAHGKPAPDLFLHAAATLGVEPGRCLVVEDSRFGVEAARAAGMSVLGYAGGLTPASWLEGPHTTVFTSMDELAQLIATARVQTEGMGSTKEVCA